MPEPVRDATALLNELSHYLEWAGENPFKVRAFERGAEALAGREDLMDRARAGTLTELEGVGKGIAEVLSEYFLKGTCSLKDELEKKIPKGLPDLVRIRGLGAKRAREIIAQLNVHSIGELEYACRENRLMKLKGFGEKAQAKIMDGIRTLRAASGKKRLGDVDAWVKNFLGATSVQPTGALRRRCEVLETLEFIGSKKAIEQAKAHADGAPLPIVWIASEVDSFGSDWARTTASDEHWTALETLGGQDHKAATEADFYKALGLKALPPESRETSIVGPLSYELMDDASVQGVFHNHTTRSDGSHSAEDMVLAARALGYRYIGISDHSPSAVYAHGLKEDDLKAQEKELRDLQQKYPDIRIFWGVESDILADGALDYSEDWLKRFDFVIGSIHSRFQMDREPKEARDYMTRRLETALKNPYIDMWGHPTGRLLLGRTGYEFDEEKIFKLAAEYDVAIEINANPERLDLDWRKGGLLRAVGARVVINPDAHNKMDVSDTRFGVTVARKALLDRGRIVNTMSADEVARWLTR